MNSRVSLQVKERYRVNRHNETYVFLMDDGVCEKVVNNERWKNHGYDFAESAWDILYKDWTKSNYMEFETAKAIVLNLKEQRETKVYGGALTENH